MFFCFAMQSAHARRKKAGHGCCGRTIEAQPLSDQTCHIEDVLAASCQSIRKGFGNGGVWSEHIEETGTQSSAPSAPRQDDRGLPVLTANSPNNHLNNPLLAVAPPL
jgi:hypothetical protein